MKPRCRCRNLASWSSFIREMEAPPMVTSPRLGFSRPASWLSSVLLPEPEVPKMQQISPRITWALTLLSARTTSSPTR